MLTRSPFFTPVLTFALLAFALASAHAQSATATLSGLIVDERGAAVSGVTLTLLSSSKALERHATTDNDGGFTFPLLPPDGYILRARRAGFSPVEVENVVLNVNDQRALRIQLRVGEVGDAVTIKEKIGVEESPAVGTVIDRQFVERLPLNGRGFMTLITLSPGVVLTKATVNEQGQFSVNGQRANANYFTVDGVSANLGVSAGVALGQAGAGSLPGLSATGGTNSLVSVEAVQEFKILTSTYAPEFGRMPGGQVSLVTRSGSNEFHGSLYNYFRNDALDANDWFANRDRLRKPSLRQNNFGGVFGGPVLAPYYDGHNRTFFFLSYEGLRLRQPLVGAINVPSLGVRQTAPDAVKPILNAYPLPNGEDLGRGMARFSASYSDPTDLDTTSLRADHLFGGRHALFARYNQSASSITQRVQALSTLSLVRFDHQSFTAGLTSNLSAAASNDLRVGYADARATNLAELDDFGGARRPDDADLFPSFAAPENSLISFDVSGLPRLLKGKNSVNRQRLLNVVDGLSIIRNAHQVKFGFDYRRLTPNQSPRLYEQAVSFTGVIDADGFPAFFGSLLSGRASSIRISSSLPATLVYNNLSVYGQDTWRLGPRLMITYGLRWELNPPPHAQDAEELIGVTGLENLDAVRLGPPGNAPWRTFYRNFAPRIGGVLRLSQRNGWELSLRAGFGIFYDAGAGTSADATSYFPFGQTKFLFSPVGLPLPLDEDSAAPPPFSLDPPYFQFAVADPRLAQPRTYQWNASLTQSFDDRQTISVTYLGAQGRRLFRRETLRNFSPDFLGLVVTRSDATSDYHALQVQWQRRLSRGLQSLVSYAWSHSIDTASNDSLPALPSRLALRDNRGPSDFDVRHVLTGAVTYDLPDLKAGVTGQAVLHGWSINSIFRAQTATPVDVVYSRDIGYGVSSFRPDLAPGIPLYVQDRNAPGGRRINNAPAFVPGSPYVQIGPFVRPAEGRQGTLGRNALRGFPLWQVDFALKRQFNLTEKLKLQFQSEFFNVFNRANFADPRQSLNDPLFGLTTSLLNRGLGTAGGNGGLNPLYQVGGPRSIQLALKFSF